MSLTWWIESLRTQSELKENNIKVQFGDEIVLSLIKSIGHSPRRPNLHFTKQNLVTSPSQS